MRKLLGPGRYRINPKAYEVTVIDGEQLDNADGQEKRFGQNHGRKLKAAEVLDGKIRQTYQDDVSTDFSEVLDGKGLSMLYGLVRNIYIPQEVRLPIQQSDIAEELTITHERQQLTAMTEADLREKENKGVRNRTRHFERKRFLTPLCILYSFSGDQ